MADEGKGKDDSPIEGGEIDFMQLALGGQAPSSPDKLSEYATPSDTPTQDVSLSSGTDSPPSQIITQEREPLFVGSRNAPKTLEVLVIEDNKQAADQVMAAFRNFLAPHYGFRPDPRMNRDLLSAPITIEGVEKVSLTLASDGRQLLERFGFDHDALKDTASHLWKPTSTSPQANGKSIYLVVDQLLEGSHWLGLQGVDYLRMLAPQQSVLGGVILSAYADPLRDVIPAVGIAEEYLRKAEYFGQGDAKQKDFVRIVGLHASRNLALQQAQIDSVKNEKLVASFPDKEMALLWIFNPITAAHVQGVASYAGYIANQLLCDPRYSKNPDYQAIDRKALYVAAVTHDEGKFGIPVDLLSKPGRLTDEERAIIRSHPLQGVVSLRLFQEFMTRRNLDEETIALVMNYFSSGKDHHETPDGKGYPYGYSGKDYDALPVESKILLPADIYEAMTSESRTYKTAKTHEEAIAAVRGVIGDHPQLNDFADILEGVPASFRASVNDAARQGLKHYVELVAQNLEILASSLPSTSHVDPKVVFFQLMAFQGIDPYAHGANTIYTPLKGA